MSDCGQHRPNYFPDDVPEKIDISAYDSIWDMVRQTIKENPNSDACNHMGSRISYEQLDRLSLRFSGLLQHDYNVKKGDRVALILPNILAHPIALFGCMRAGAIVVNVNPLATARELKIQLNIADASVAIILDNLSSTFDEIANETSVRHVISTQVGDFHKPVKRLLINLAARFQARPKRARHLKSTSINNSFRHPRRDPATTIINKEDIAFLQFTGGTTGTPKAAVLTHGNMIANTLQAHACISPAFNIDNPDVITALPLYHIFALTANCLVVIRLAGCSHLITNPRELGHFVRAIKRIRPHAITGVNTMFSLLLGHPGFRTIDFSRLQLTLGGGMSVQAATATEWQRITGSPIIEAYGLTEASPAITTNAVDNNHFTGAIGYPLPSTEVTIRDSSGEILPPNEPGELWAKGPQVMSGYWNQPDETSKVLTPDGWLKTGDLAVMDPHGQIKILDRMKDMIIVSGFNVYPNEIEEVLDDCPGIRESGVSAMIDDSGNEIVKAVIVKNSRELKVDDVLRYCRKNLAAYKVPRVIEFSEELPKSAVGKILRRKL